jgi:GNAT superfamily N-acetyltransferase
MRQLLSEQLDWDAYYSHNTGGEHANRVSGHEADINSLRERAGLPIIDSLNILDYAFNDGYVFVADNKGILRAHVLANNDGQGTYTIEDLVVDPDFHGSGLGKFVLGKLAAKVQYRPPSSKLSAQRITIEPSLTDRTDLVSWLCSRGFHDTDESDSPTLLLPGQTIMGVSSDQLDDAKEPMPSDWNGCIEVYDKTNDTPWTEVFRNGTLIGKVTPLRADELHKTRDRQGFQTWIRYELESAKGRRENGMFTSEDFAVVALLNHKTPRS